MKHVLREMLITVLTDYLETGKAKKTHRCGKGQYLGVVSTSVTETKLEFVFLFYSINHVWISFQSHTRVLKVLRLFSRRPKACARV